MAEGKLRITIAVAGWYFQVMRVVLAALSLLVRCRVISGSQAADGAVGVATWLLRWAVSYR